MQKRKYKRLTDIERKEISRCLANKQPIRETARQLGRATSTISREIDRNSGQTGYRAFGARKRARIAASSRQSGKSKIAKNKQLRDYVHKSIKKEWSPVEISERIQIEYPLDMAM